MIVKYQYVLLPAMLAFALLTAGLGDLREKNYRDAGLQLSLASVALCASAGIYFFVPR